MIKTITLTANEETATECYDGCHVIIKNLGENTIYASKSSGVIAESDGVMSIDRESAEMFPNVCTYQKIDDKVNYFGTLYLICESDIKVELKSTNSPNFKQVVKGGDESVSIVSSNKFLDISYAITGYAGNKEEIE